MASSGSVNETAPNWDTLVSQIAGLARTPGHATTNGPPIDMPHDPISAEAMDEEERRLGIRLPLLLRRLYTEVGNGGFGPGYGLLTLIPLSSFDHPIAYFYTTFRAARGHAEWPAHIVPFSDWGCLIMSCIDMRTDNIDPPVVRFEPNMSRADTLAFLNGIAFSGTGMIPASEKLSTWFQDWIARKEMFERPYQMRK